VFQRDIEVNDARVIHFPQDLLETILEDLVIGKEEETFPIGVILANKSCDNTIRIRRQYNSGKLNSTTLGDFLDGTHANRFAEWRIRLSIMHFTCSNKKTDFSSACISSLSYRIDRCDVSGTTQIVSIDLIVILFVQVIAVSTSDCLRHD
jgi:hypothetical protein